MSGVRGRKYRKRQHNHCWHRGEGRERRDYRVARDCRYDHVEEQQPHSGRTDGATAHKVAELHGNPEIAAWLLAHGGTDELSALERFIAACARADRAAADAILAAHPGLRSELGPEHHLMLHRPAESGNAAVLETMLGCGFNPEAKDKDNVTPLHRAAMGGHVEAVQVLLKYGADVNA